MTGSAVPRTMRAIVTTGHGGVDRLEYRDDVPVPVIGDRDVLVAVSAAAVNATDLNTRVGWYGQGGDTAGWTGEPLRFPRIQGIDACGRIVEVGSAVDPARLGERVVVEPAIREPLGWVPHRALYLGSEIDGSFAEYVAVPAVHAWAIRSDLSDHELATLPCAYGTAENMLTRGELGPTERVLVTGASGGVGSAAVQLAAARGAFVVAVAATDKHEAITSLGADLAIGRGDDPCVPFGPDAFDLVVDLVGGPGWPRLLAALRPGGRYVVSGAIAGPEVSLDLRTLYLKDLRLLGATIVEPTVFAGLIARVERGEVRPPIAAVHDLADIVAAQQQFESKRFVGKIVLDVTGARSVP